MQHNSIHDWNTNTRIVCPSLSIHYLKFPSILSFLISFHQFSKWNSPSLFMFTLILHALNDHITNRSILPILYPFRITLNQRVTMRKEVNGCSPNIWPEKLTPFTAFTFTLNYRFQMYVFIVPHLQS